MMSEDKQTGAHVAIVKTARGVKVEGDGHA